MAVAFAEQAGLFFVALLFYPVSRSHILKDYETVKYQKCQNWLLRLLRPSIFLCQTG